MQRNGIFVYNTRCAGCFYLAVCDHDDYAFCIHSVGLFFPLGLMPSGTETRVQYAGSRGWAMYRKIMPRPFDTASLTSSPMLICVLVMGNIKEEPNRHVSHCLLAVQSQRSRHGLAVTSQSGPSCDGVCVVATPRMPRPAIVSSRGVSPHISGICPPEQYTVP